MMKHLRLGLMGTFALLIIFLFAADKAFLVFQQQAVTRKAAEELLRLEADTVRQRIEAMEKAAEQLLELLRRWTEHEKIDFADIPATNTLLMGYMQEYPFISSVNYGDSRGNGFLILRLKDQWLNRIKKSSVRKMVTWNEVNTDGTVRNSEQRPDDYDPRLRPWYAQAEHAVNPIWSLPYVFRTTKDPGITVSLRITPAGKSVVGVVGVDVMLQDLSTFLAAVKRKNPDLAIAISLPDETLLASSEQTTFKYHLHKDSAQLPSLGNEGFADMRAVFNALKNSPADFVTVKSGNRKLFAQRVRFDFSTDIAVDLLLAIPQQAMLRRFQPINFPWLIFATTCGILLCLIFARRYLRPVQLLTKAMRSFGSEGHNRPEFKKRNDEIGLLAQEFNRMTDELTTERQRLLASEQRYRHLFESVRDGIYATNNDDRFTKANKTCAQLFGFDSPAELLGKNVTDFWAEPASRKAFLVKLARDKSVQTYPITAKRRTGEIIYLEASCIYLEDAQGGYLGVEGILRDITRTVLQSQALTMAVQEWQNTFDAISDYVSIHDRHHRIIKANRAMVEFFGGHAGQLLGKKCHDIYHQHQQVCAECPFQRTMLTKAPATQEINHTKNQAPLLVTTYPILDPQQEVIGCVHVAKDLSEQKALEAQLLQAQKMEAIGRLAGGIAHDFNNMLSVIIGYGEMILYTMPPDNPFHDQIKEIVTAGKRSADLTRQLLAFARKQPIQPRVLDLNDIIYNRTKMISRLIGENIDLRFHLESKLWNVFMDPAQLDQILVNLAVNSRDAIGDQNGDIVIETANVELNAQDTPPPQGGRPGQYVMIVFSDNGCGIPPDLTHRVFEPFFSTKEQGKGTGLGLATVFGVVTQNDGFITLESAMDKGAKFKLFFPRFVENENLPADDIEEAERALPGGVETILVAEDEEGVRLFVKNLLESLGYTVLPADNPATAIATATRHQGAIDLLLTDVVMPGGSGTELWETLHAMRPELRCVFMSGYSESMISSRGLVDRGVNYIQKPFSQQELARKIRAVLQ